MDESICYNTLSVSLNLDFSISESVTLCSVK